MNGPRRQLPTARRAMQVALAQYPLAYERLLRAAGRGGAEKRSFLRLIRSGDVVVDVGANDGYFTMLFSDIVGASGRVYAFEPVAPTFDRLTRHVREAVWFQNVTLERAACTDAAGSATMLVPDEDWGQAALVPHHSGSWTSAKTVTRYEVSMLRLDDYVAAAGVTEIDFLKVDAEGAELRVIRGACSTLSTRPPLVALEVYGEWTRGFGYEPVDLIRLMQSAGYDCLFTLEAPVQPVTVEQAAARAAAGPINLLCATRAVHAMRLQELV